jgi:hypothetical protein
MTEEERRCEVANVYLCGVSYRTAHIKTSQQCKRERIIIDRRYLIARQLSLFLRLTFAGLLWGDALLSGSTCALKYTHLIFLENSMRNKEIPEPLLFSIKTSKCRCWSAVVSEEKDVFPIWFG